MTCYIASSFVFADLSLIQHNFSSCGKTGRSGSSYDECVKYYKSQNSTVWKLLKNRTDILEGAQFFKVPSTRNYDISIAGASGGKGVCSPYVGGGAILHSQRFLDSEQLYVVTIEQLGNNAVIVTILLSFAMVTCLLRVVHSSTTNLISKLTSATLLQIVHMMEGEVVGTGLCLMSS